MSVVAPLLPEAFLYWRQSPVLGKASLWDLTSHAKQLSMSGPH